MDKYKIFEMTIDDFIHEIPFSLCTAKLCYSIRRSNMNACFYKTVKVGAKINYSDIASSVNLLENGYTKHVSAVHA